MLSTGFSSRVAALCRSAIAVGADQVIRLTDDADATGQALAAAAADVDTSSTTCGASRRSRRSWRCSRPDPTAAGS